MSEPGVLISAGAVVLLVAVQVIAGSGRKKWSARTLCFGALAMALSFVLSYVKIYHMPTGGSVTLASMLPIMLFAMAYGPECGMSVGLAYGLMQYLQGGWFCHPVQFLLDYPLAFGMLGLAGIRFFRKGDRKQQLTGMLLSMFLAALGRAVCAVLAGWFFWGSTLWASIVYNGTYLLPDTAICMALAVPLAPRLVRMMRGQ